MRAQLFLAFFISLLHGFIPSHWLPLASLAHKMKWSKFTTYRYASMAAWAHSIGTIIIGLNHWGNHTRIIGYMVFIQTLQTPPFSLGSCYFRYTQMGFWGHITFYVLITMYGNCRLFFHLGAFRFSNHHCIDFGICNLYMD